MHDRNYISPYKHLIVGADTTVPLRNGRLVPAINFDNAATTPPFSSVLQDVINFAPWYSSVHRGSGYKSQLSSYFYEEARDTVMKFLRADPSQDTVIFVKNTTEAINKVAHSLASPDKKQVILSTSMEHHSNDLPWRRYYHMDYIKIEENGRLNMDDLEEKLLLYKNTVKLVVVAGASNVTGHKNPIHRVASLVHRYNCKMLVDGAQLIPHAPVDLKPHSSPEHIDYMVFSGHKMYSPFGVGVLVAPKSTFVENIPDMVGGGTVDFVTHDYIRWSDAPKKEEAGTPNLMGVVALVSAIRTLNYLGLRNIEEHEYKLLTYCIQQLHGIPDIELYGDCSNLHGRVAIIPFNIKGISHEVTAKILSMEGGIAVRNGCFCAQPYVQQLLKISQEEMDERIKHPELPHPGMVRISFGLYNDYQEINQLVSLLTYIVKNKKYFKDLYHRMPDFF